MFTLKLLLASSLLLLPTNAHNQETCEEEIARENAEDWKSHACRSCKEIIVNAAANCPPMGFDCDPELPMHTNTLSIDSCDCSHIRCADANATLAVGGELVSRVSCSEQKWTTPKGDTAVSAVCARKCGVGICSILPSEFFSTHPDLLPYITNPPDNVHPCAWGSCPDGAIASNSNTLSGGIDFEGPVEFSCSGYRTWMMPDNNQYSHVACKRKTCEPLDYDNVTALCGVTNEDRYSCYAPLFTDDETGNAEKRMECDEPNDLRFTHTNQVVNPICSNGYWTDEGDPIDNEAKVLCLTCPIPILDRASTDIPAMNGNQKKVTCTPGKELTLSLWRSIETTEIKIESLTCTTELKWNAAFVWGGNGGEYSEFSSLAEAVDNGVKFGVSCT